MFKISFEFDETNKQVSNVRVTEIEKPKNETKYPYDVSLDVNKLRLTPLAMEKMGAQVNDRLSVQYISEGVGKSAPVIGKSEVFTDALDGNRIAATLCVPFRGEKNSTLKQFGDKFIMEQYKEGMWKLVKYEEPHDSDDISADEDDLESLNPTEVDAELKSFINSMDLPF